MTVSVWLTRAFWMPGGYVVGFDTYAYSGPNLEVTKTAIGDGRLPLVNPFIFAGVPHLGNPQTGVLYPAHLLAQVFDTNRAMGLIVTAHVMVLGLGMLVLARRLGFSRVGATAASVVAVAAGASLTKTVQFEQIQVFAWTPLLIAAIHGTLTSPRRWEWTAALAGTTAATLLAGHPQLAYQTIVLAVAATIGFAVTDERWRRLPLTAIGAALGALSALPQLVASLFATADSAISSGRTMHELNAPGLTLVPKNTARALLGTIQDRDPAAFAGSFEAIGFVGVVAAIVAVVGVMQVLGERCRRSWGIAFVVLGGVALLWAYGPESVFFRAAYHVVPGFDLARASARWVTVVVLIGAVFAGAGVDALTRGARTRHLAAAGAAAAIVGLGIAVGPLVTADRRSATIWIVTAAVVLTLLATNALVAGDAHDRVVAMTAVAVVAVGTLELALMSLPSMPQILRDDVAFTDHATETTEWLAAQPAGSTIAFTDDGAPVAYQVPGLRPNTNAIAGIPSPDGYDGGVQITERWAEALRRFTPTPAVELPLRNSLQIPLDTTSMARLGVRFVLIDLDRPAETFIPGWVGPRAIDPDFAVYENPDWIGDAVAWRRAAAVVGSPADLLREDADATRDTALVDDQRAARACDGECAPIGLDVEFRTPEHLVVETDLDDDTIVSIARQALPGWSVSVDGEPADEILVDGLFLGVEVPAGEHVVEWRYRSPWFGWTLGVALLAMAASLGLAVAGTVARRADSSSGRVVPPIDVFEA